MNDAIMVELRFFGASIFWGMLLLIIYDMLRILRRVVKHNGFFIAIQDILYWVTCSLLIFHMMYQQNNGIIRGFSILAMLIGMLIYHAQISDLVVYVISEILNKTIKLIGKLIALLFMPIRIILNKTGRLFRWLFLKIKKIGHYLIKSLKNAFKTSKIAVSENEKGD